MKIIALCFERVFKNFVFGNYFGKMKIGHFKNVQK